MGLTEQCIRLACSVDTLLECDVCHYCSVDFREWEAAVVSGQWSVASFLAAFGRLFVFLRVIGGNPGGKSGIAGGSWNTRRIVWRHFEADLLG